MIIVIIASLLATLVGVQVWLARPRWPRVGHGRTYWMHSDL